MKATQSKTITTNPQIGCSESMNILSEIIQENCLMDVQAKNISNLHSMTFMKKYKMTKIKKLIRFIFRVKKTKQTSSSMIPKLLKSLRK